MICFNCKIPLNINEHRSVEVQQCPQCQGVWIELADLEKLNKLMLPVKNSDLSASNEVDDRQLGEKEKARTVPHFLSGAFDVGSDW